MEEKIGSLALCLRWIDPPFFIADEEGSGGGSAVNIFHTKRQLGRGRDPEQHVHFAAEAYVLRPLADIKNEFAFPLTGLASINLHQPILNLQAR